eukprot:CAMPEP_0194358292 /NCGR_PEP_ID=MMETSP0174-20130528/5546_1 /TAXON_ID=216777 /ORGANISM="Proboscia alata, Strain PI-D3" /LENGTH=199 /DNA_ID=CAMNT_0039128557 /DNA_START=79 /DNA_END=678 /DNA_ORIENTATION=-
MTYLPLTLLVLFCSRYALAFVAPRHMALKKSVFMSSEVESEVDPFEAYVMGRTTVVAKKDTVKGDGEISKKGDILTIDYVGRLLQSGTEFDKGTMAFKLGDGNVIPGWEQGLEGLRVGGKRTLKIPPNLAYGERGAGDVIPGNADLSFECELKSVGSGPIAEILMKVGVRRLVLGALFGASFLLPKDLSVRDIISFFGF